MEFQRLDIVQLINNSTITKLSNDFQTKLLTKIQESFTDNQQQLFVASFYSYLSYNSKTDFVINLDDVWKWLGFSRKEHCKTALVKHFTKDIDYKVALPQLRERKNEGGFNKETILMTINTFKKFCLKAGTKKADEIHDYYIKLEELMQDTLKEEFEEQKIKMEEQQQKLEFYETKPSTHGFLSRRSGYVYMFRERSKPGHYKIGLTYDVDKRLRNLNTSSSEKSIKIYNEIESYDCELLEIIVHKLLKPFNIIGRREWFYFDDNQAEYALATLHRAHNFLKDYNHKSYEEFSKFFDATQVKELTQFLTNEIQELQDKETTAESKKELTSIQSKIKRKQEIIKNIEERDTEPKKEEVKVNKTLTTKDNKEIKETNIFKLTGQQLSNKTGKYKGACWSKEKSKWKAELKINYKIAFLGYFDSEEEAATTYNDYALFINNKMGTNYALNDIPNYQPNPRDVPEEHKEAKNEKKTSCYNGVSYSSTRKYYIASIKHHGKTYNLGNHIDEIECAKLYNQQAIYFNQELKTNYVLNDIPNWCSVPKNIYQEIQDNKSKNKTSQYYGVTFNKRNNKYRVVLVYNKKQIHIGFFENELDAAKAYNEKASELNKLNDKLIYKINVI